MPPQPTPTHIRLIDIKTCLTVTLDTVEILATSLKTPFLGAIAKTTQSLLKNIQTVKQNKDDCTQLMGHTYELLNAIIIAHIQSETASELPPNVLNYIGRSTETLHKIHAFIEAQQSGSKVKNFLRQGEMNALLKDCKTRLQQELDFFQAKKIGLIGDIRKMREDSEKGHQDVLNMIESLSDTTSSDVASTISRVYSSFHNSSNSIPMLPSEPKIFHGRESELSEILKHFQQGTPRLAILGAGGMGKTSLARAIIHHAEITGKYEQYRYFVACDAATNIVELAALIGDHLGLQPGKDLTRSVIDCLSDGPSGLLILDNLETAWESEKSRDEIEEFLSLLTSVDHLALLITMRGAERPAKVRWTRPFLQPLKPLRQDAARQMFIDIADNGHNPEEVDKVLLLTDNLPLAINLLAHLVDSEGCSNVLSRWEADKTSLISDGYDQRSNLDISISLSLSSPRIAAIPHAQGLLSLLSMLPNGLSDVELLQCKLPIDNILSCKTALMRTALAYSDEHKHLKALVPIREYMQMVQPPSESLLRPLLRYFQALLDFYTEYNGSQSSSSTAARISLNFANIQNLLVNGLRHGHPDLVDNIYCACWLNNFSHLTGRGQLVLMNKIHSILPQPCDHRLEVYLLAESLSAWRYNQLSNPEALIIQALEHFDHFDDPDMKCRFYIIAADYYHAFKHDYPTSIKSSESAISLALSSGNTKRHAQALKNLIWINWYLGDYSGAKAHIYETQHLARISADLHTEAWALRMQAMCSTSEGAYKESISLCTRARDLLQLCGLSGGDLDDIIMSSQAEVHKFKSEYVISRSIHAQILEKGVMIQDPVVQGLCLLNIAEIDVPIGAQRDIVQQNIDAAKLMLDKTGEHRLRIICDCVQADLCLREGDILGAKSLFCDSLALSWGKINECVTLCLERLADASCWDVSHDALGWTTVFLVHSLKLKQKLGIHKGLQFLGDIFLARDDEDTAVSLFTVALGGFTQMDVHRSRGECMVRLGGIFKRRGNLLRAVQLWELARPLLEKSSQAKQVEQIDERLASIREDALQHPRENAALPTKLNINGNVKDSANNPSAIQKSQPMNL